MGTCYSSPIHSLDNGINVMMALKENYRVSSFIHTKASSILIKISLLKNSSKSDEEKEQVFNQYYKFECDEFLKEIDRVNRSDIIDKIDMYITQHNCVKKITNKCIHNAYLNDSIWREKCFSYYDEKILKDYMEMQYKNLYKRDFRDNFIIKDNGILLQKSCGLCK